MLQTQLKTLEALTQEKGAAALEHQAAKLRSMSERNKNQQLLQGYILHQHVPTRPDLIETWEPCMDHELQLAEVQCCTPSIDSRIAGLLTDGDCNRLAADVAVICRACLCQMLIVIFVRPLTAGLPETAGKSLRSSI